MNARGAVRALAVARAVFVSLGGLMIRFATARQYVGEVHERVETGQHLDRAAALRAHERRKVGGVDPQLVVAVIIEIQLLARNRLPLSQRPLRNGELMPDRVAQMRQVQASKDAMPVGVVALRAPQRPPRLRWIAAPAGQVGERDHYFVHAVRLW